MTAMTADAGAATRSRRQKVKSPKVSKDVLTGDKRKHAFRLWLMILPLLLLVAVFAYYPLFGWAYAFFNYQPPIPLSESPFVGFYWFQFLWNSPAELKLVGQVIANTFAMSGLGVLTSFFPVIFAICLREIHSKFARNLIQTLTTLPNFISWVLVYAIAFALFSTDGMVNSVLTQLHWISGPIAFLASPDHVWLKMMLWGIWKGLGWSAILYLAAIAGIDQELYEAAEVDGANRFQQAIHITIPSILPTYYVLLMLQISNFLSNGLDQYFVFNNPFNQQHIQVLDLFIYNVGMGQNSYSLATAISIIKSVISVLLLWAANWASKRVRGVSII